jgi:hypothetical protein
VLRELERRRDVREAEGDDEVAEVPDTFLRRMSFSWTEFC